MSVRSTNIILVLCCFFNISLYSQWHKWDASLHVGGGLYKGDITSFDPNMLVETQAAYGLSLRYKALPYLHVKTSAFLLDIAGDDLNYGKSDYRLRRAFQFQTSIREAGLHVEWHPLKHFYEKTLIKPYISSGIVFGSFDPSANFERTELVRELGKLIIDDQEQGVKGNFIAVPISLGGQLELNDRMQLELEATFRLSNSDFLDGVSHTANPNDNDWYGMINVGFTYQLGTNDKDRDGIVDAEDECPDHAGTLTASGCPDIDGDGLMDRFDRCPEEFGSADLGGCPDRDHDKVADRDDLCPDQAGLRSRRGCPILDTDEDGIEDTKDKCPMIAGPIDNLGCPVVDSDDDGITDVKDRCPYEFGIAILDGCPDTDGDGIEDSKDNCPQTFGEIEFNGCPPDDNAPLSEVTRIGKLSVQFDRDSERLGVSSYKELDELIRFLNTYSKYKVELLGYASIDEGKKAGRRKLAENRALSSYKYLISEKIDKNRITYQSRGIDKTGRYQDRSMHRRVEFRLYKSDM
jgi:outer membrane protein OmpA-like peptidoglycan-associated protein